MSVSIGSLVGHIELDDELSSALELLSGKVEGFAHKFEHEFGALAIGAAAAVAAVTGITVAIVELGMKGSEVNDLRDGFERLAGGVEKADNILAALREGTKGTIDDLKLMT